MDSDDEFLIEKNGWMPDVNDAGFRIRQEWMNLGKSAQTAPPPHPPFYGSTKDLGSQATRRAMYYATGWMHETHGRTNALARSKTSARTRERAKEERTSVVSALKY
jgi:hypothetical protein